jgi:hypothetical protein
MESRQKRNQSRPRTKSKGREAEMESWTSREQTESVVVRYGRERRPETTELIAVSPEVKTQSIDKRDLSRSALNVVESEIPQRTQREALGEVGVETKRPRILCHVDSESVVKDTGIEAEVTHPD